MKYVTIKFFKDKDEKTPSECYPSPADRTIVFPVINWLIMHPKGKVEFVVPTEKDIRESG